MNYFFDFYNKYSSYYFGENIFLMKILFNDLIETIKHNDYEILNWADLIDYSSKELKLLFEIAIKKQNIKVHRDPRSQCDAMGSSRVSNQIDPITFQRIPEKIMYQGRSERRGILYTDITPWYFDICMYILSVSPEVFTKHGGSVLFVNITERVKELFKIAFVKDKKFVYNVMTQYGYATYGRGKEIYDRLGPELFNIALKNTPGMIKYLRPYDPLFKGNQEELCSIYTNAVSIDGKLLREIDDPTFDLCKLAIKNNPEIIKHIYATKKYTNKKRKILRDLSILTVAKDRVSNYTTLTIITNIETEPIYDDVIIISRNYLLNLYKIFHKSYALPQLNLLQITANSHEISQIFDVHELISGYI